MSYTYCEWEIVSAIIDSLNIEAYTLCSAPSFYVPVVLATSRAQSLCVHHKTSKALVLLCTQIAERCYHNSRCF